jgi:NADPH:quinone reductase-like Zn-dependent oxidoreductase
MLIVPSGVVVHGGCCGILVDECICASWIIPTSACRAKASVDRPARVFFPSGLALPDISAPSYCLAAIMTAELQGKVGLVTGGTSSIGRDTAILFAKTGAKVVVAGRREMEGNETVDLIRATGGDGVFAKADVSNAAEVDALVRRTVEEFARLDIAFNNAGIEGRWLPRHFC